MNLTRRGILAVSAITFAGCGILPEESEPVEASASAPATLPDGTGYREIQSEEQTVETTVNVDLTGDVELNSSQDVIATVFRRVYEADDGSRFGLVTAPATQIFESPDIVRDPVASLETARVVELATGLPVESVGSASESGSVTLLGQDTTLTNATATTGDGNVSMMWTRVRAGEDSVTAIAGGSGDAPFDVVTRDG